MDNRSNNILDFEDPGMLADELMHVPGFVNELMNHTLAVSPRPNKPLAFAGALAMTAHLSGRTYRDVRGTRTNLYLAALAPSGMGKDEPRVVNKRLADGAGCLASVPDSIASGQGLEDAMAESPSLLLQCDEADTLLTAMRGEGSAAAKFWAEQERRAQASGEITPYVISETPEANAKLRQLKDTCDEVTKRLMASDLGTAAALYVRIPEKATKLAMLYALSENPLAPEMTGEAIAWGAKVVTHLTKRMLYMAQFYVAEGKFDRLKKRAMGLMSKFGGKIDHSTLLRKLAVDAVTFKKIINTLEMSNLIEREFGDRGKQIIHLCAA